MKIQHFLKLSLGISLATLPFVGGGQKPTNSSPVIAYDQPSSASESTTNAPPPEQAEQALENAPGQIVSAAKMPSSLPLSAPAAEIVKLAQAGVDEGVMLAYVTNSTYVFKLTSDDIVYLNDVGVSGPVITAMLQRDQAVKATLPYTAAAPAPLVYTNQYVPISGAPVPYAAPPETEAQPPPPEVVDNGQPAQPVNVSSGYFYDSLAPYGNWVNIAGYGLCWQPTVVAGNRGWQPYCDRGRWVYSDCGWYWASDYTWGWAPFHYGRWFQHSRWGWCWAPDTVWGPSWVSWRYTSAYCGWAPLPPTACYTPGIGFTYYGRSVGVNFSFGLTVGRFAFVPVGNFCDRQPSRFRVPRNNVTQIYNTTVVVNQYDRGNNNRIINHGIPVDRVRTATHTEIHPVRISDTDRPVDARFQHQEREANRTLTVYRPSLPQPTGKPHLVGEGVKPAPRQNIRRSDTAPTAISAPQAGRAETAPSAGNERFVPTRTGMPSDNSQRDTRTSPPTGNNPPLILHGPDQNNVNRSREFTQPTAPSAQPQPSATPAQNNPTVIIPNRHQTDPQVAPATPVAPAQYDPRTMPHQRQLLTPTPPTQSIAPIQHQQQVIQPAVPAQQTVPAYQYPIYQSPRAAARESQPHNNPAPNYNSAPARTAPPMQTTPPPPPNTPSSYNNSRQDRRDH